MTHLLPSKTFLNEIAVLITDKILHCILKIKQEFITLHDF